MSGESRIEGDERNLYETATWAVAGVCAVIIIISFALEKSLHSLGMWFSKKHKKGLYEALEKVKGELMVLGFISLLLTFSQGYISKICIPSRIADTMLPCKLKPHGHGDTASNGHHDRRLLLVQRRVLLGSVNHSCKQDYEPLITVEAAHQLHILIFFLALFHVFYSAVTMMLGKLKIRGWKDWERETSSLDYEITNDSSRFRLTHETSFVKVHNSFWARSPVFFYVGCFFRQFFKSVTKADYLTLRNGFINTHIAPKGKFDFQKYIKRSLEDDFKVVVGVSPVLWASFVIFLLLNVNGWHTLFWASILPLIVVLFVGTKLQAILTMMALEITERHTVVQGIPLVKGSDEYFWFSKPQLILHLLHFTLFQNAFQITYFLWILYEFGSRSCFHDKRVYLLIKIIVGLSAMILCSYSILPLYALVAQMGSHMKKSIFDEQTSRALKKWRNAVKNKQGENAENPSVQTLEASSNNSGTSLRRYSSGPILHRFMSIGNASRSGAYDILEESAYEGEERPTPANLIVRDNHNRDETEITIFPTVEETRKQDDLQLPKQDLVN